MPTVPNPRTWLVPTLLLQLVSGLASPVHAEAAGRARSNDGRGLILTLDPAEVPEAQRSRLQAFLNDALSRIPESVRISLDRSITVRFRALDAAPGIFPPPCVGEEPDPDFERQVLGEVRTTTFGHRSQISEVSIHRGFVAEILGGEGSSRTYSCGHKNLYRLALATLIHELGHLYDYLARLPEPEALRLKECEAESPHETDPATLEECHALRWRLSVSNRPEFLELMGWTETGAVFKTRKQGNHSPLRSPDPYEFTHSRESFAVNFEYFVLDPEFACRRPAVHAYYSSHFGWDPHPDRNCRPRTRLILSGSITNGRPSEVDIDPSRIYQIHALFAGKGDAAMSRWGHSLFRIITCAPERQTPGPDCMNDVAHHVAVSFRANVPDAAISYLKGLTGGYSSILVAQPFLGVIEEYNKGEFRELVSLPLRLTLEQRRIFVHRVLEASWEYSGRYRFISNNCAVEALNFLKGTLGAEALAQGLGNASPVTPVGLHKTLQKLGIVDASPLRDLEQASMGGHYFASKKPELERAYEGLRQALGNRPSVPRKVEGFLDDTLAAERRDLYESLWKERQETREFSRRAMGSRFFLLESYAIRRAEKAYLERLGLVLEGERWDAIPESARSSAPRIKALVERLRKLQQEALPVQARSSGYGIPLEADSDTSASTEPTDGSGAPDGEQERIASEILAWAREAFAGYTSELEAASKNRSFFLKEMRKPLP